MKTETKVLGATLILTAVLLFGGIFFLSRSSNNNTSNSNIVQIDYSKGQKIGTGSAKVKLVEFSDFQCPACAAVEPYLEKLRSTYPDQLQLIYRHFPLPQHKFGRLAANLAEAAGEEGKFWEIHKKLFETQEQWSGLTEPTAFFLGLARELGLNEDKVKQALEEDAFKAKIDDDVAEGYRLRINSTPTFFLNGQKLILQSFDDIGIAIEQELKK